MPKSDIILEAWNERRIFGKVRYMSYNACRGKFDTDRYIQKGDALDRQA